MHLKVFLKLKNPNTHLFWANILKTQKNHTKNKKKTTRLSFKKKNRAFSNPAMLWIQI